MTRTSRCLPSMHGLTPDWHPVRFAALPTEANHLLILLIEFANENGITPSCVDEVVLARMMEAASAAGHGHLLNIEMNTRRGLRVLRELRPHLGLPDLPMPGREWPGKQQWASLEPELRNEITAFVDTLERSAASSVKVKNLLLHGLVAAE